MRIPRRCAPVASILALCLISSSCTWTHRVILRGGKRVTSSGTAPPLQNSNLEDLLKRITNLYNAINSFQATVNMTPSVGSVYKNEIKEGTGLIRNVTSYVLFRKPDSIRIIGLAPVVRTTEFDMTSIGDSFKVYLVAKNMFVEGLNSTPPDSKSVLENMRPEHFLSAMLIKPLDRAHEIAFLEDNTDEENAIYEVHFIRKVGDTYKAGRVVYFDRLNLSIIRQKVFDDAGMLLSDTRYSKWTAYNGIMFPASIDINRDDDGYGVAMEVTDMKMNTPQPDDKFVLTQPEGSTIRKIGAPVPGTAK